MYRDSVGISALVGTREVVPVAVFFLDPLFIPLKDANDGP